MARHLSAVAEPLVPSARSVRGAEIIREIAIGGLAGLLGGLLVVRLGGRLFMRVAALIIAVVQGVMRLTAEASAILGSS